MPFRLPLDDNVFFCGFTSESSFGGWSYLITRPENEGGNILIDSPRFATQLVKRIEALGGVKRMLLTHKDDIADHELFTREVSVARVRCTQMMALAVSASNKYLKVKNRLNSTRTLIAIPTPGHTRGHVVFLYRASFCLRVIIWRGHQTETRLLLFAVSRGIRGPNRFDQ